jgi:hypothetical protein
MSDQTLDTIGKKLKGGERRDAVHFAVAPVRVEGFLRSGERVKFAAGTTDVVVAWDYDDTPPVGIIDPFLEDHYVADGDRCWIFLYPNTITGLRHEWTHPAFPDQQPQPVAQQDETPREYSERWLRGFAEKYRGDYNRMIAGVADGTGAHFGEDLEYGDFRPGSEFWHHVSVVTGKTFTDKHMQNTSFRCAC